MSVVIPLARRAQLGTNASLVVHVRGEVRAGEPPNCPAASKQFEEILANAAPDFHQRIVVPQHKRAGCEPLPKALGIGANVLVEVAAVDQREIDGAIQKSLPIYCRRVVENLRDLRLVVESNGSAAG